MEEQSAKIQLDLLEKAKQYLRIRGSSISPENYLVSWAFNTLGYLKLKCLHENKLISKDLFKFYLRSFIYLGYEQVYCLKSNFEFSRSFKNIVISWCSKEDFLNDGSFQCRYFQRNSAVKKDILWVLISIDNFVPSLRNDNIQVFIKNKSNQFLIRSFFKNLLFCLWHQLPFLTESVVAKKLGSALVNNLQFDYIKTIFLPYEAQPWQHVFCILAKQKNSKIQIIGDLHTCLSPLPTDFIKRVGSPDKLIVHGEGQKNILNKLLGWSKKEIEVSPYRRVKEKEHGHLLNRILIPYDFKDSKTILNCLRVLFEEYGSNLPRLHVKNHPIQMNSEKHKDLMKNIEQIQDKYHAGPNYVSDEYLSVVIGASSSVIECLTLGLRIIHIVEDPIFESYCSGIWKDISVKFLFENVIEYKLNNKSSYMVFKNQSLDMVFEHE